MIEEKLIISDTNIFIDLISINALDKLFLLPCDIFTTDFVVDEIEQPKQSEEIFKHIDAKNLKVVTLSFDELIDVNTMKESSAISITDCSVLFLAKKTSGRLLSGDGKLRKVAEKGNVKVSGILYIFDNLIEYGFLDKITTATLLEHLMVINSRLPKGECEKMIEEWREKY